MIKRKTYSYRMTRKWRIKLCDDDDDDHHHEDHDDDGDDDDGGK